MVKTGIGVGNYIRRSFSPQCSRKHEEVLMKLEQSQRILVAEAEGGFKGS